MYLVFTDVRRSVPIQIDENHSLVCHSFVEIEIDLFLPRPFQRFPARFPLKYFVLLLKIKIHLHLYSETGHIMFRFFITFAYLVKQPNTIICFQFIRVCF